MPVPLPPTHGATPGQLCMIRRTLSAPVPPGPSRATVFRDGGGSLRGGSPWPMLHLSTESCGPALPGSPWPMLHLSTENCGPALPGRCCGRELWAGSPWPMLHLYHRRAVAEPGCISRAPADSSAQRRSEPLVPGGPAPHCPISSRSVARSASWNWSSGIRGSERRF